MEVFKQELIKIFFLEAFNNIVIFALIVAAIIVCYILRRRKIYFVSLFISVLFFIIMIPVSVQELSPLCDDIINDNYVTVENVCIICDNGFDSSGFQNVLVLINDNSELVLKTKKSFDEKSFIGTVVYSEESKYLVFAEERKTSYDSAIDETDLNF